MSWRWKVTFYGYIYRRNLQIYEITRSSTAEGMCGRVSPAWHNKGYCFYGMTSLCLLSVRGIGEEEDAKTWCLLTHYLFRSRLLSWSLAFPQDCSSWSPTSGQGGRVVHHRDAGSRLPVPHGQLSDWHIGTYRSQFPGADGRGGNFVHPSTQAVKRERTHIVTIFKGHGQVSPYFLLLHLCIC